jgi:hypothetical protein
MEPKKFWSRYINSVGNADTVVGRAGSRLFTLSFNGSSADLRAYTMSVPNTGVSLPQVPPACVPGPAHPATGYASWIAATQGPASTEYWISSHNSYGAYLRKYIIDDVQATAASSQIALFLPSSIKDRSVQIMTSKILFQVNNTHFVVQSSTPSTPVGTLLLSNGVETQMFVDTSSPDTCVSPISAKLWIRSPDRTYAILAYQDAQNSSIYRIAGLGIPSLTFEPLNSSIYWTAKDIQSFTNLSNGRLPVLFRDAYAAIFCRINADVYSMVTHLRGVGIISYTPMPEPASGHYADQQNGAVIYSNSTALFFVKPSFSFSGIDFEDAFGSSLGRAFSFVQFRCLTCHSQLQPPSEATWKALFLANGDAVIYASPGNITYLSSANRTLTPQTPIPSSFEVAPIPISYLIDPNVYEFLSFSGGAQPGAIRRCDSTSCSRTAIFCPPSVCDNFYLAGITGDIAVFGYLNGSTYIAFLNITSFNLVTLSLPFTVPAVPSAVFPLSPYVHLHSGCLIWCSNN